MPDLGGLGTRGVMVSHWIRDRIINGVFPPDTHLQEQPLAEQTGTSRTPVREALKLLEHEQLIIYSPNRGYVVRRFAMEDMLNAFDVRATLEGMVCRIVAERGLDEAADKQMIRILKRMKIIVAFEAWGSEECLEWFDQNAQFHRVLIEQADNAILAETIARTQRLPLIFDTQYRLRNPSQVSQLFEQKDIVRSFQDHDQLYALIKAGESVKAEALMRSHIDQSKEIIRAKFSQVYPHAG